MKNKQKVSSDKFTMMTQMPVNKLICKMAVPTIITMLVSAVYNMADTYFVGKIGTSATGAVGVVFSFMAIIQACGFFFGHGSGNYMSRKLGEQKTEEASVMASTGFFSSFAVGVIIGVLGLIFYFAPVKATRFNRYHFAVHKTVSFLHSLRNAVYDELACA